jgi:DNA-binding PadR family transcriptional regulator
MSKSVRKQDRDDGAELLKLQALREKGKEHIRRFREYCTNDHQLQDLNRLGQRLLQQERKEQQVLVNDRGIIAMCL